MAKDIVKNLKFKKQQGKFDPNKFAGQLNEAYLKLKRPDGFNQKKSFSPSSVGYGYGNCPRYWYMAFTGADFTVLPERPANFSGILSANKIVAPAFESASR